MKQQVVPDNAFGMDDGMDFFDNLPEDEVEATVPIPEKPKIQLTEEKPVETKKEAKKLKNEERETEIQKSLMVGNYAAAVNHCLEVDRMSDALLIAHLGGLDLYEKTKNKYNKFFILFHIIFN